jgi:hypothetical protein
MILSFGVFFQKYKEVFIKWKDKTVTVSYSGNAVKVEDVSAMIQ